MMTENKIEFSASKIGKFVGGSFYLHTSALSNLTPSYREQIEKASGITRLAPDVDFNVIKIHAEGDELSLLSYPDFFDAAFPALCRSWRINVSTGSVAFRNYSESRNPPILHRKELLLEKSHARIPEFISLTEEAEALGLFREPNQIGFRESWYQLIADSGYELDDHRLVPIANARSSEYEQVKEDDSTIRRHLTALSRSNFSAPVQALLRHGLINKETTFFDYGCGRGDDIRTLLANGIDASGWDPHFASEAEKRNAHAVNLGFVINVIEDLSERTEALKSAYSFATGVLSVAAMLTSNTPPDGKSYRDGFISSRNTFQKYFSQAQLRDFIEHTLDVTAIAASTGVFLVFRDKDLEQQFLSARYGRRTPRNIVRQWEHRRPERQAIVRLDRATKQLTQFREVFEQLWSQCLIFGRVPEKSEFSAELLLEIESKLGSLSKANKIALSQFNVEQLERARKSRVSDLMVWGALEQFQKRKPYSHLEERVQRDIKIFFGDYPAYRTAARIQLFEIGNLELIDKACREASEMGYGYLDEGHSLQLHSTLLERLPAILRVYIGCATVLCGDISEFDLIKIHIRSGKVTLMKFEDFEATPLPRLLRRIKVKLRDQNLDVFDYDGEYTSTLLFHKSRYINEEFLNYTEQLAFDQALDELALFDPAGYGPSEKDFYILLDGVRRQIEGFSLIRSKRIPTIDEACGSYFTYTHFIQCGETQARTKIENLPKEADSYNALYDLATIVLTPIIDYFGMITLTYGFCSSELAKEINGRIAPSLDQHASHEKNRNGKFICTRLGAACDLIVLDEDMEEVAQWALENTAADRIYFYGKDKPIHISYSTNPARQLVEMRRQKSGKLVPKIRTNIKIDE